MSLHVNQIISASGYFTDSKYLHGTLSDFETNLGYHYGRLKSGFYIAYLLDIPKLDEFELAGYSITPKHRFEVPANLDINKLKKMARDEMIKIGNNNLVKVFPKTRHNDLIDSDEQYPYGRGGIPQWNLTKELPMHIFRDIEADEKGVIYL